ncbi:P-loop NTPase fold protein [Silvimonas sp.]|uniref:KAP family P-loop NTPase fold protein n=1 Tax=Silvimonas sp. TaxID=2650811 RepID=UPI00284F9A92|nr:P-loop NTPase fold protein [Silvimonas sp.]MDR3429683.1 P-loop NTPase fold protein [Silvimonas sp.]
MTAAPWHDDKLNRKEDAEFLTKLLNSMYTQQGRKSFVLAINAEWGAGKTYLMTNWAYDLAGQSAVIRFNAWENDFSDDPLISFMAELNTQLDGLLPKTKTVMRKYKKQGRKLVSAIGQVVFSAGAKHLIGMSSDHLKEMFGDISQSEIDKLIDEAAGKIFETHHEKKKAISDFKMALAGVVEELNKNVTQAGPLVVLIDELDRCRPDFSVSLLEGIKHVFDIPGVFFVLAMNRNQLRESIRVLYGAGFDSTMYLKRFFDMEYSLVEPTYDLYTNSLFDRYGLTVLKDKLLCPGQLNPTHCFNWIACAFDLKLRDRDQVAMLMGVVSSMLIADHKSVYFPYALILTVLKHFGYTVTSISNLAEIPQLRADRDIVVFFEKINMQDSHNIKSSVKAMYLSYKWLIGLDLSRRDHIAEVSLKSLLVENTHKAGELPNRVIPPLSASFASCAGYPKLIEQVGQIDRTGPL